MVTLVFFQHRWQCLRSVLGLADQLIAGSRHSVGSGSGLPGGEEDPGRRPGHDGRAGGEESWYHQPDYALGAPLGSELATMAAARKDLAAGRADECPEE